MKEYLNFINSHPSKVDFAPDYLGIRYWKEMHFNERPQFKVFEFVAGCQKCNSYFFRQRHTPYVIKKTFIELNSRLFSPFLLNFGAITEALENLNPTTPHEIQT